MVHRHFNPFAEPARHLDNKSNPYLPMLREAFENGDLPVRYGLGLKDVAGTWKNIFAQPSEKLILEIGCHLGRTICEFAEDYPEYAFIGADITFKRVCKTAMRAKARSLNNIQSILFNAKSLDAVFAKQELDG